MAKDVTDLCRRLAASVRFLIPTDILGHIYVTFEPSTDCFVVSIAEALAYRSVCISVENVVREWSGDGERVAAIVADKLRSAPTIPYARGGEVKSAG